MLKISNDLVTNNHQKHLFYPLKPLPFRTLSELATKLTELKNTFLCQQDVFVATNLVMWNRIVKTKFHAPDVDKIINMLTVMLSKNDAPTVVVGTVLLIVDAQLSFKQRTSSLLKQQIRFPYRSYQTGPVPNTFEQQHCD